MIINIILRYITIQSMIRPHSFNLNIIIFNMYQYHIELTILLSFWTVAHITKDIKI